MRIKFLKLFFSRDFLREKSGEKNTTAIDESHILFGKTIVITGFRDDKIEDKLKKIGAKIGTSVSKNIFVVLVKDKENDTGKSNEAKKLGIPIMTMNEFVDNYF